MYEKNESPRAATRRLQNQSPINNQQPVTDGATPQARKQEKIVARVEGWTGTTFPYTLASMVHDAVRTGLRVTDKEEEEAKGHRLHCNAEYHFMRMTGQGSTLVPLLYGVSLHLAGESKNFHITLQHIAHFLGVNDKADALYGAADLLVASGFWEVIESKMGAATHYRPLGHKEWAEKCGTEEWNGKQVGKYCTVMAEFPFKESTPEYLLGKKLYGISGEKYFGGVLKGWLKLGTVSELENWAKEFMQDDGGNEDGIARRVRLANHFRACAARRAVL